jgi:putative DNA primase/helicase
VISPLELAIQWAGQGVPAFPIAVGYDDGAGGTDKRPLNKHGHLGATCDPQELALMFMDARLTDDEVLGVGLLPGAAGFVVFDLDVKNGKVGFESADEMGLPDVAYMARTASGGLHVWLRKRDLDRKVGNRSAWVDVDIRGDGGWVVAPGVTTPWGSWEMAEDACALADTPLVPEHLWGLLGDYLGPKPKATSDEVLTFLARYADVTACRYAASVIRDELAAVTTARVHEPGHHAAMRIGELMRAGCAGADAMLQLEERWLECKPGSEAEWGRSLAAAAASTKEVEPCDHRPTIWRPEVPEETDDFGVQAIVATLADSMLADRFLDEHRAVIRYITKTEQFSVYNAKTGLWSDAWRADSAGSGLMGWLIKRALQRYGVEAGQRAHDAILRAAGPTPSDEDREEARKAQHKIENDLMSTRKAAAVRAAVRAEAAGMPGIAIETDAFDAQPYLIADPLGVIDLRTGQRSPHDPALLLTQALPVAYDPDAQAPQFMAFLEQAQPLLTTREYLQRREGSALLGKQLQHAFHIDLGEGRNGKGVFNEVVTRVMGTLGGVAPASLLLVQRNDKHEEEIARLRGLRRVWIDEARDARSLDAATAKKMSGGARRPARFMRGNSFEYYPSDIIVLSTNELPKFKGDDSALMARLHIVPWDVSFKGREDLTLVDRLVEQEAAGVLAWMVAGAMALLAGGGRLDPPQAVIQATEQAGADATPMLEWIEETLDPHIQGFESSAALYQSFRQWMQENNPGERIPIAKRFGRDFAKLMSEGALNGGVTPGKPTVDGRQVRGYNGLTIHKKTSGRHQADNRWWAEGGQSEHE